MDRCCKTPGWFQRAQVFRKRGIGCRAAGEASQQTALPGASGAKREGGQSPGGDAEAEVHALVTPDSLTRTAPATWQHGPPQALAHVPAKQMTSSHDQAVMVLSALRREESCEFCRCVKRVAHAQRSARRGHVQSYCRNPVIVALIKSDL